MGEPSAKAVEEFAEKEDERIEEQKKNKLSTRTRPKSRMVLLIDSEKIPAELRHYMLLWFELMFQSPAIVDGKQISFEEVSKLMTKDLVSNSVAIGVSGYYGRLVSLRLRVDSQTTKIIAICAKKLANAAADAKRDGYSVASFLSSNTIYDDDSNAHFCSHISLERFHKE
uniref:Uncharacterized protein n=1 Tax=Ditylenchus dipsaci TaxID=166011 RepID=A0A915EEL7_9BILA